jgi:hypothetical protein
MATLTAVMGSATGIVLLLIATYGWMIIRAHHRDTWRRGREQVWARRDKEHRC